MGVESTKNNSYFLDSQVNCKKGEYGRFHRDWLIANFFENQVKIKGDFFKRDEN